MITDFYFLDLEFSEFRVDSSKQNTEPLPISWILWLIFIRFQDSRKFQCQSHDHIKFLMCYFLSGLKKTARISQNALKKSPPKASQTQKIVFRRGGGGRGQTPSRTPPPGLCPGPTRGPKRPPWPLAQFEPPSTLRSGSGPDVSIAICEQQRCRSACASAQSDQHLCFSLLIYYNTYTCSIQSFKILASFVAEQVGLNLTWPKIPEDTFSHDTAHFMFNLCDPVVLLRPLLHLHAPIERVFMKHYAPPPPNICLSLKIT